jgi:hypothetical protein
MRWMAGAGCNLMTFGLMTDHLRKEKETSMYRAWNSWSYCQSVISALPPAQKVAQLKLVTQFYARHQRKGAI